MKCSVPCLGHKKSPKRTHAVALGLLDHDGKIKSQYLLSRPGLEREAGKTCLWKWSSDHYTPAISTPLSMGFLQDVGKIKAENCGFIF